MAGQGRQDKEAVRQVVRFKVLGGKDQSPILLHPTWAGDVRRKEKRGGSEEGG